MKIWPRGRLTVWLLAPPEPMGISHQSPNRLSNWFLEFGGATMRFDDTNPAKEDQELSMPLADEMAGWGWDGEFDTPPTISSSFMTGPNI